MKERKEREKMKNRFFEVGMFLLSLLWWLMDPRAATEAVNVTGEDMEELDRRMLRAFGRRS